MEDLIMAKYVCPICGYVLEADSIPEGFVCPQCKCPGEKFKEQTVTFRCRFRFFPLGF